MRESAVDALQKALKSFYEAGIEPKPFIVIALEVEDDGTVGNVLCASTKKNTAVIGLIDIARESLKKVQKKLKKMVLSEAEEDSTHGGECKCPGCSKLRRIGIDPAEIKGDMGKLREKLMEKLKEMDITPENLINMGGEGLLELFKKLGIDNIRIREEDDSSNDFDFTKYKDLF